MSEISVIIPVYNSEKYLKKCLDSLLNQTFKNFEIICVNDGSVDNSLKILEEYKLKDNRIVLINSKNEGPGSARNKALDVAKGRYIIFVDSDDWVDEKCLEIFYTNANITNADITECQPCTFFEDTSVYKYRDELRKLKKIIKHKNLYKISKDNMRPALFNCGFRVVWKKMYKRELFDDLRFKNYLFAEDSLVSLEACFKSKIFSFIPDHLYYYRLRQGSVSHDVSDTSMQIFSVYDDTVKILNKYSVYNLYFEQLQKRFLNLFSETYSRVPDSLKDEYKNKVSAIFTNKYYKKFSDHITGKKDIRQNFLRSIFSVTNVCSDDGSKFRKRIVILGRQFIL